MKKFFLVAMIVLMMLFAVGCSDNSSDKVVGSVNGVDLYQDEFDTYFSNYFLSYYENYYSYFQLYMGVDLLDEESASSILATVEQDAWDVMVEAELIRQLAAEKYGITFEDNYLKDILPYGDYKTLMVNSVYTKLFDAVEAELLDEMIISDEDVLAAYNADPAAWTGRSSSHIIITFESGDEAAKTEAYNTAKDIINQLNEGADFADMAAQYSDDGTAANGGVIEDYINSYGKVLDGSGAYSQDYANGLFALAAVGDYSQEPVLSEYGYHIIRLDDIKGDFDTVKDLVADSLKTVEEDAVNERLVEIINEAKDNAEIVSNIEYRYYSEEAADDSSSSDDTAQE